MSKLINKVGPTIDTISCLSCIYNVFEVKNIILVNDTKFVYLHEDKIDILEVSTSTKQNKAKQSIKKPNQNKDLLKYNINILLLSGRDQTLFKNVLRGYNWQN